MTTQTQFIDTEFPSVIFTPQSQAVYFRAKGLKKNWPTTILINDVNVEEYTTSTEVLRIEFREDDPTQSRLNWKVNFQRGSSFTISEPILGSTSSRKIAKGLLDYVEVLSFNSNTKTGIANVHVYLDGSGPDTLDTAYQNVFKQRVVTSNATFMLEASGGLANNKIIAYYPKFSVVNVASSNTIQLFDKVANSEIANANSSHYIVGKKIFIMSGLGAGQNATVASYNATTGTITTSTNFDVIPGALQNTKISFSDRAIVRFGEMFSDATGTIAGIIKVPSFQQQDVFVGSPGWQYYDKMNSFRRDFKYYAKNKYEFRSKTLTTRIIEIVGNLLGYNPRIDIDPTAGSTLVPTTFSTTPVAQTFFVDDKIYPQGLYLTSVRLLLEQKDESYPLQVQLRPMTGGIPDTSTVVPGGNAFIDPIDVKTLTTAEMGVLNLNNVNPFSNSNFYSEATFPNPVYLASGKEYALVVISPSSKHTLYISQVGQKVLGTIRTISTQPYLGVLYKSQGTSVWTASPNEDLAFEMMKARYSTTVPAVVDFRLKSLPPNIDNYGMPGVISLEDTAPLYNVNVHSFFVETPDGIFPNTKIEYQVKTTRADGTVDDFLKVEGSTTYEFDDNLGSRVITSNSNSFFVRASSYTNNPHISPFLDFKLLKLFTFENIIGNNPLDNSSFFITDLGEGYSNSANVTVTITGGGGTGATARANVQGGKVIGLEVINGGYGYTGSPNVIISRDTTATVNAQASVIGEDQPYGSVSYSKYITRKFSLADGISAGDLRVLFSAMKPKECEIDVYYKVLSEDDFDKFENKKWTLMTVIGGLNTFSLNNNDYKAYIYAPGSNNKASNKVTYDGFTTFKYFAIKLVMRSTNPFKIPKVKNLRVSTLAELYS